MKSIMEEASSLAKAIENGWLKAGKPEEFSVKIFEHPQKNFIGMTVKNAKIAIIFDEKPVVAKHHQEQPIRRQPKPKKPAPQKVAQPEQKKPAPAPIPAGEMPEWTSDMISYATSWIKDILANLDKAHINFVPQVEKGQLVVVFEEPLAQGDQNKYIMRPLSQLLVQTLRNQFKKPLRGYKVIMKAG